jgi:hypothetical protein
MKGVLKHNHPWLMSLILCHHAICTDTLVKVCVHDAHAIPVHIVTCGCSDDDENIVFDEDDEKDEGFLFAGQGTPCFNYLTLRFH